MKFLTTALLPLLLLAPKAIQAANEATMLRDKPDFAREVWRTGDDMPEGIAFEGLLTHIMLHARQDHAQARHMVKTMFRTSEAEASELLTMLLDAQDALAKDERRDLKRLLCPTDQQRPEGEALYVVWDTLDDTKILSAQRQLEIFRASLPFEYLERFSKRIAQERSSGGVMMVDHA